MWYIKVKGMGKLVFADTYESYGGDTQVKHIEGFIVDQKSNIPGNFGVNDIKEVTFTVSADGTTAETTMTTADYNYVPEVGDYIWVRLKDDDGTTVKLQVTDKVYDEFVYTNTDATSEIHAKHNTVSLLNQDWNTDNLINAETVLTLEGLTEAGDNTDWEVITIAEAGGDTTITLKQVADEDVQITAQDPLDETFAVTVDVDIDEESLPANSAIHAKENVINILTDTTIADDGLIEAGDSITLIGCDNASTGDSSDGVHVVEAISDDGIDVTINIHNTTLSGDMTDETFLGSTLANPDETITTASKDISYDASSVVLYADRNDIEINYTGATPEILDYLEVSDTIVLTADGVGDATNNGTYTINEIDTSQTNKIIITVNEAIPSDSITNNTAGDKISTDTETVVYTNASASSEIIEKVSTLEWHGLDLTPYLDVGDSFSINNTATSVGTYVVRTINWDATKTTITVDNSNQLSATEDPFDAVDDSIGVSYKKYFPSAGDTIVRAKSTLVIHDNALDTNHALTGEKYTNTTDMNDLIIRRDGKDDIAITIETISDDGTDTTILVEEHIATIADLADASIIAPDRAITFTNSVATSEIVSGTSQRIIIQCANSDEMDVLATYFDYPEELTVTMANGSTTLGGGTDTNNGSHTIEAVDINVPDLKFIMYISNFTTLYDETLNGLDETFIVNNDFIWIAGIDSAITEVNAYLYVVGDVSMVDDGYITDTDAINITGMDENTALDGDFEVYSIAKTNAAADTIIYLEEVTKQLVNETLDGTEEVKITKAISHTNTDAVNTNFSITSYAQIHWYGENLTTDGYILQNETLTLANTTGGSNDGLKNIVDDAGAVTWDTDHSIIWIEEDLTAEASLPDGDPDPAVTMTTASDNTIECVVGSDGVTSYVSAKTTESIVWTDSDLTAALPYFEAGDIVDIYSTEVGDNILLLADQTLTSAAEAGGDMTLVLTGTDLTDTYPYGLSDDITFVNKSKQVTYTIGDNGGYVSTDVDRIIMGGEWMDYNGEFTSDGYITIDGSGVNAGTWTIDTWSYDQINDKTEIILDTSHAWALTEDIDASDETVSYEGVLKYWNADDVITIVGQDLTTYEDGVGVEVGDSITIAGCDGATNNVTATVRYIDYNVTTAATTIKVCDNNMVDETLDAVPDETITLTKDVVYENDDATSSITASTSTIVFVGRDLTGHLSNGDTFTLSGCYYDGNNQTYTINTIAFGADTTITVIDNTGMVDETLTGPKGVIIVTDETVTFTDDDVTSSIVATDHSAITSDIDRIYLTNQAYTLANLKEFLDGDTFYMVNLDENTLLDETEFTISEITAENGNADTQIVIEETWQFVDETLDVTGVGAVELHTDDELDVDLTIVNTEEVIGAAGATTDAFILTIDNDSYEPTTVKITNVDFNTPVYNIDTIWDDE